MKKYLAICFALLSISAPVLAGSGTGGASLTFSNDSGWVQVSSAPGTAKQILTNDAYVNRTWIINQSTWVTILISSFSASTVGTAGNFIPIPPSTVFTPDGPTYPFWGPLWAIATGTGTLPASGTDVKVGIFRTK